MPNFLSKKFIIILIAIFTVVLGLFLWFVLQPCNQIVTIESTCPNNGSESISPNATPCISFNQEVDPNEISVKIVPSVPLSLTKAGKTIYLNLQDNLKFNTKYKVTVSKAQNKCNRIKPLQDKDYSWEFKTGTNQNLTPEDQKRWEETRDRLKKETNWPILTQDFSIDYWPEKDSFLVTLKKNPCQKSKQKVIDWFSYKNVDVHDLKIVWTIARGVSSDCIK